MLVELQVKFDLATSQLAVSGPIDQLPVVCLNVLESAVAFLKNRAAQAELTSGNKIVAARAVPDALLKRNGVT